VVLSFLRWYYEQLELSLLILLCIHKSYIIYFELSVVPIGHEFSFFWSWKCHGKSMLEKRGHPVWCALCICEFSPIFCQYCVLGWFWSLVSTLLLTSWPENSALSLTLMTFTIFDHAALLSPDQQPGTRNQQTFETCSCLVRLMALVHL